MLTCQTLILTGLTELRMHADLVVMYWETDVIVDSLIKVDNTWSEELSLGVKFARLAVGFGSCGLVDKSGGLGVFMRTFDGDVVDFDAL